MEPHLEKMAPGETGGPTSCNWEEPYLDYDGTRAYVQCGEPPEWWLVFDDPAGEVLAYEFCRPHANLALIEERGWR